MFWALILGLHVGAILAGVAWEFLAAADRDMAKRNRFVYDWAQRHAPKNPGRKRR